MTGKIFFIIFSAIGLSACASEKNRELSPPNDAKWVTIAVNVPDELMMFPLDVLYRSYACPLTRYNSSGKGYEVPGYSPIKIPLSDKDGNGKVFIANVALDGGGQCKWHLSSVEIKMEYKSTKKFGEDVRSIPESIILAYDFLASNSGGGYRKIDSNGEIKVDYLPYLTEGYTGNDRAIWIYDGVNEKRYSASHSNSVIFSPKLHSNFLVKGIDPKVKKEGDYGMLIFPDGTTIPQTGVFPDFKFLLNKMNE